MAEKNDDDNVTTTGPVQSEEVDEKNGSNSNADITDIKLFKGKFQPTNVDWANAAMYSEAKIIYDNRFKSATARIFGPNNLVEWVDSDDVYYPCPWADTDRFPDYTPDQIKEKCPGGTFVFTREGCNAIRCRNAVDGDPITREKFIAAQNENVEPKWGRFCYFTMKTPNATEKDIKYVEEYYRLKNSYANTDATAEERNKIPHSLFTWWDTDAGKCRIAPAILNFNDLNVIFPEQPEYNHVFDATQGPDNGSTESVEFRRYIKRGMPLLMYHKQYCEGKLRVSYNEDTYECFRKPGQYIMEEFIMGGLYRECFGFGEKDWRKR